MDDFERKLESWRASLMQSISVAGLISRNNVTYKWKAPYRCWVLREAISWRLADLVTQSYALNKKGSGLGARILLRSGFETLAVLIYSNQMIENVLEGTLNFHTFGEKTSALLLGSRDGTTGHTSINILTILDKASKRYPGFSKLYATLCETAHPNYEGLIAGYSVADDVEFETRFSNRWDELYGRDHIKSLDLCMETFLCEYDVVWIELMTRLEIWIEKNDAFLEMTKNDLLP